ncbi:hypothetical protein PCANC_28337, partial [Puccinia coronata f. sp. avenae]
TPYQGINTNNYTEAWHRVLKSRYIPPPECRRLDELIQIFSEQVLPDYQMEHHKVETGTIRQTTDKFQRHTKEKGESYTTTVTHLLGIHRTQFLNHFEISSFTNPTQAFYLVKFEDGGAGLKKRLTALVMEHVIRPPDSFFERSNLLALSRANDNVEEEMDEDSESDCDTPVINPLKRKRGANKDLPSLPSCPIPAPANQPEVAEEVPIDDLHQAQKLSLNSASSAIQKASKLLKTADNRRQFASNLSCAAMINFKDQCDHLSMRVQVKCSKVRFSPTASFPGIAVVGCMPTNEISKMIADMLAAAWKSLQRTQSALANVKNKEEFIGKSSVTEMDSFKNMAYKILGVIEEGSPDVPARRQLR